MERLETKQSKQRQFFFAIVNNYQQFQVFDQHFLDTISKVHVDLTDAPANVHTEAHHHWILAILTPQPSPEASPM